jgi:sulfur-carrier protein adenylyltransferase/sulfurtransferase
LSSLYHVLLCGVRRIKFFRIIYDYRLTFERSDYSMSVKIIIPAPLRLYTGKQEFFETKADTVGEALIQLTGEYRDLHRHLYNEQGKLRSFVNIYVNNEDIRYLNKDETPVGNGDTISIVPSIAGGIGSNDTLQTVSLTNEEIRRYSRHLIMPEVGIDGQRKLKAGSVLMIGAGGLGSPAGLYLAAAGIGRLGIVDYDVVDESNLQRQVLYSTDQVGQSKLEMAKNRLQGLNPHIRIDTYEQHLSSENALDLFKEYDVIVDGTDNFPTRYLVNDACVLTGKPNVYGSIFRFEGQASVFGLNDGPCYRCLYPEPPPPGLVPSCAEGGVFGVLPGIVGSIQANEAIKLITGIGEPLKGRLLLFDALKMTFRELKLRRNRECPVCGDHPTQKELIDYEQFCGVDTSWSVYKRDKDYEIEVDEFKKLLDEGKQPVIIDVREEHEYAIANIGGRLIPLRELPSRLNELDSSQDIVVHCKMGGRSQQAVELLKSAGFRKVRNLVGGIDRWAEKIDTSLPRY